MKNLIKIVVIASLGGLLAGYDTGIISGAILYINKIWHLSDFLQGVVVSSVLIGAILGALVNGFLADFFGRKKIMLLCGFIFVIGSIFCGIANSLLILIFSRVLLGFAIGAVNFVAPLYLSEMSPKNHRGMIISLYQWSITGGILFSYVINAVFANSFYSWRWMFICGAIPGMILFVGMLFLDDTPRWLISQNKIEKAEEILNKISPNHNNKEEIKELMDTFKNSTDKKFEFQKWMLKPFVIGIGIMFIQICTGINNIIYYAPTIFKTLGFSSDLTAIYATIGIGIVNFLTTVIAIFTSDKFGRKPLLYIGLGGMAISLMALSVAYMANFGWLKVVGFVAIVFYIISFAMSLGPIALILISEIFPLKIRGLSMSLCILANYFFNFIIALFFPIFLSKLGGAITFNIFAIICLFSICFVYFLIPETKGISLERIENNWMNDVSKKDF